MRRDAKLRARNAADLGGIALLSALLASGDGRIAAAGVGDFGETAIEILVRAGFLIPDGHLETTICDACEEPHLVPVIFDPGCGRYDGRCPVEGLLGRSQSELAALSFTVAGAATLLADAMSKEFEAGRDRTRLLEAGLWLLGSWRIGGAWTAVAIVFSIERLEAAQRVGSALANLPVPQQGLVLVPGLVDAFRPPRPFVCIPFETTFDLDASGTLIAARGPVVALATTASAPLASRGGRPEVGDKVAKVLNGLVAQERILPGCPNPGGIVARSWKTFFPGEDPPRPATIRKYAALWRKGSSDHQAP